MRTTALRPKLVPLLVILCVTSLSLPGPAAGDPGRESTRRSATLTRAPLADFLHYLWGFLVPTSLRKSGCQIDPDGQCASSQTESGCQIDPRGQCGS